jgi:hypothetical protein
MDIEQVEPISASSASSARQTLPANAEQAVDSTKKPTRWMKLASGPKWGWQDAPYLLTIVLLVVAMGWYFTPNFTGEVPGIWWDPLLNMWTLSWDTTTLLHAPTHLWQAQLLYPNNLTLSYSENLLGEVIFFAPFFLITHNPVLAYNVTFYTTFLLCGTNMYFVARYYSGKRLAAFVAALIYAFAPYRLGQIDHIHVVAGEWMPLAFLYLDLSFQQGRWRHWSLLALFYLLQILSSIYYGIFLSYALLAYILFRYTKPLLLRLRQDKRQYLRYLVARAVKPSVVLGVMFIIMGILMAPYLASLHSGLVRSLSQTEAFSAFVRDFTFTAPFNWLHGTFSYNGVPLPYDSEHYLFLGWTTMGLAALGIVLAFRRHDLTMRALIWTALVVFLFSFGPALQFSGPHGAPVTPAPSPSGHQAPPQPYPPNLPMPWLLAYYLLPGFKGLRVPARLTGVLLIILALLGAYAVAWLQDKRRGGSGGVAPPGTHKGPSTPNSAPCHYISPGPPPRSYVHRASPGGGAVPQNVVARGGAGWWGALVGARPFRRFVLLPNPVRGLVVQCLLILVSFALIVEALPARIPVTVAPTGNHIPAVYQWLATHGGQQAIVELPISQTDGKYDAWYDYYAIYHPHPIVNGWSGYRPPLTERIAASLLSFPSPGSLATLRQYHIQYVVLHLQRYSPGAAATILAQVEASPGLYRVAVFGSDSVWQVK